MDTAKIEVALGRHVGNVGWDPLLLAQFPYLAGSLRVVDGGKNHVGAVEICGIEVPIDVGHLLLGDSMGNFGVQSGGRADDRDVGIGVETVQNPAGGDL